MALHGRDRAEDRFGLGDIVPTPFPTVTSAFYHHSKAIPDAIAIRDLSGPPRQLTYGEVARRAQILAAHLRSLGVRPNDRIPLVVKRGLEMVVGIMAILSCGAQYVPLDGGVVPDSTIRYVVEQSGGSIVICLASTADRVRSLCPDAMSIIVEKHVASGDNEDHVKDPVDLSTSDCGCYVIYTSGTTGKPKGVDVTQKNAANITCLFPGNLGICPGMSVGSVLNISFDMAAWEIFACLCNGGTLVLRGSNWEETLQQIDVLICTPSILAKYHPTQLPRLKAVATAGEPTSQGLADLWATHTTYWNCCGPTETTIVNTMQKHIVGDGLSIGKPTPNNTVYILDGEGRPVAPGVAGVMWAGGSGVSRGYVGLESKTKEAYVLDPFANDGSRMYKTGDLGRWRPDGSIEILGRVDDQVKVKGFRVELDGIAASLASTPGVSRATALLIDGQIHGFACPSTHNAETILAHTRGLQPYYAVPTKMHLMNAFPTTPNGKVDKKALHIIATAPMPNEKRNVSTSSSISDQSTIVDSRPTTATSVSTTFYKSKPELGSQTSTSTLHGDVYDEPDLFQEVPGKLYGQPFRGIRHRVMIVYRTLFSVVWLLNVAALVAIVATHTGMEWLATLTAINLVMAVLVRQDLVVNCVYTLASSLPKGAPLWMRTRCAKIFHLGGVHSGAAVCATAWLYGSTIQGTIAHVQQQPHASSLATLVVSWLICLLCGIMIASAWPSFRKQYHDVFERLHRFLGWTALSLFWVQTILSVRDHKSTGEDYGLALVKTPAFWLLVVATLGIASSWLWLRKVPVKAEPLSDHAIKLTFDYTVPVNGTATRLSNRPLLEWHSFATIPIPEKSANGNPPGYSVIVSNAGDWTRNCIRNPPTRIWVRGLPACGVMRIATLFNSVVVIATGSGIGPLLGHILNPTCPTKLIWSTKEPDKTFGKDMVETIRRQVPDAVIHDTKTQGRPDLVRMGYNLAKSSGAEAVIIIANERVTKKVVYGLETRGIAAFGAIFDS